MSRCDLSPQVLSRAEKRFSHLRLIHLNSFYRPDELKLCSIPQEKKEKIRCPKLNRILCIRIQVFIIADTGNYLAKLFTGPDSQVGNC